MSSASAFQAAKPRDMARAQRRGRSAERNALPQFAEFGVSTGNRGASRLDHPRAFSMNCGRSALFQSGMALIFFSFNSPSAIGWR